MNLIKLNKYPLGRQNGIDEQDIQDFIEQNIKNQVDILNIGVKTKVIGKQLRHQCAGILDLLLESEDGQTRYVVELMLGELDPSHIIRAIEYWDIERRTYPEKAHVAVLVSEGIGRYLNVIGLLGGAGRIPLTVIQMNSYKIDEEATAITFSRVLDQQKQSASVQTLDENARMEQEVAIPAQLARPIELITNYLNGEHTEERKLEARCLQTYISIRPKNKRTNKFIIHPRIRSVRIEIVLDQIIDDLLSPLSAEYNSRTGSYHLNIDFDSIEIYNDIFTEIGNIVFGSNSEEVDG